MALINLFCNVSKVPFGSTEQPLTAWFWSDEAKSIDFLEETHDYIQWILPSKTPSAFNPDACVLSDYAIDFITNNYGSMDNIFYAATLMLSFWGIEVSLYKHSFDGTTRIKVSPNPPAAALINLVAHNHNERRMTRLIHCLRAFGLYEFAAKSLFAINDVLRQVTKLHRATTKPFASSSATSSISSLMEAEDAQALTKNRIRFANHYLMELSDAANSRSTAERVVDTRNECKFVARLASPSHPAGEFIAMAAQLWQTDSLPAHLTCNE